MPLRALAIPAATIACLIVGLGAGQDRADSGTPDRPAKHTVHKAEAPQLPTPW